MIKKFTSCIILCLIVPIFTVIGMMNAIAIDNNSAIEGIVRYKLENGNYSDVQQFIDMCLSENSGNGDADWYAVCLSKYGAYDFSGYNASLLRNIDKKGQNYVEKLRMAIASVFTGGKLDYDAILQNSESKGIMCDIYSLQLMNLLNYGADTQEKAVSAVLSLQLSDGGWALSGTFSDPDVTAMALQALAPYAKKDFAKEKIGFAIDRLSKIQLADGGYKSFGTESSESCSQVIIALSELGIDPLSDERFVKNGFTAVNALMTYQLESGAFSHTLSGSANDKATVQAFMAMQSLSKRFYSVEENKTADVNGSDVPKKAKKSFLEKKILEKWRYYIIAAAFVIFTVYNIRLIMKKSWRKQRFTVSLLAFTAVCAAVVLIKIQSPQDYYGEKLPEIGVGSQTVIMSVNCRNINKGYLIPQTEYAMLNGDTAFDLLKRVTAGERIPIDYIGVESDLLNTVYVKAINNIYEMDYGPFSGWRYSVNGDFPNVGCGSYKIQAGDVIEWIYEIKVSEG